MWACTQKPIHIAMGTVKDVKLLENLTQTSIMHNRL